MSQATLPDNLDLILKKTSRAFYLSLALLPGAARGPLSLAYLLARAADTVADSEAGDPARRVETLEALQQALDRPRHDLGQLLEPFRPSHHGEEELLRNVPALLEILEALPQHQRNTIAGVVRTLISGMIWDQQLFTKERPPGGLSVEELDRYTYLVAGCVGPFWSTVCSWESSELAVLTEHDREAVEFGKALQWVNILRDIPRDQSEGRFYLPPLDAPAFSHRFLTGANRALLAFSRALVYPGLFPTRHFRHRLAVFLPLVLGMRTLEKLFRSGGPRPGVRIKVSRREVFFWLASGAVVICNDRWLQATLGRLHRRAAHSLTELENTC